ncbi:uncharacterized protein LOC131012160 [Salvia miltiorrhiza]|uniref:uncharacterized protein LOC131012160 n=1 Tax=Salvia miltiorrhiza TaxID=226208 RepID=UPI0025AB6481|nr:uncharacterized protein LOC131012160 [Salvia miltiorrhiza]XP_057796062.1 uncharacterized protein LOC131012160 [Salvia miltiorrhiza]
MLECTIWHIFAIRMPPKRGCPARNNNNRRNRNAVPEEPQDARGHNPCPPPPTRRVEELFLRQNPPTFDGTSEPAEAEIWVRAMERIFNFLRCTDEERLSCVSFQLTGSADFWWEARRKILTPEQWASYTWEDFKTGLYDKYIPKSYRKKKEAEFYELKQGKKSVVEYDKEFCNLSRFAPQQVDTEEKMAEKFCAGLRYEIKMALASHGGLSYTESLNRALDIEAAMPSDKSVPPLISTPNDPPAASHTLKGKRKWDNNEDNINQTSKKVWQEKEQAEQFIQPRHEAQTNLESTGGSQSQRGISPCPNCGKMHRGICRAGTNGCYNCGQKGHYSTQCPNRQRGSAIENTRTPLPAIRGHLRNQPQSHQ